MIYQLTSQFTRDSKNDVSLSRVSTCMNYFFFLFQHLTNASFLFAAFCSVTMSHCTMAKIMLSSHLLKYSFRVGLDFTIQTVRTALPLHNVLP